jgi:hypothetical protein
MTSSLDHGSFSSESPQAVREQSRATHRNVREHGEVGIFPRVARARRRVPMLSAPNSALRRPDVEVPVLGIDSSAGVEETTHALAQARPTAGVQGSYAEHDS